MAMALVVAPPALVRGGAAIGAEAAIAWLGLRLARVRSAVAGAGYEGGGRWVVVVVLGCGLWGEGCGVRVVGWLPAPSRRPFFHWPTYTSPLTYEQRPCPCRTLDSHCPSYVSRTAASPAPAW